MDRPPLNQITAVVALVVAMMLMCPGFDVRGARMPTHNSRRTILIYSRCTRCVARRCQQFHKGGFRLRSLHVREADPMHLSIFVWHQPVAAVPAK
eukprot:scaffold105418_cov30-Tisochrysis_lutea.AAC.2